MSVPGAVYVPVFVPKNNSIIDDRMTCRPRESVLTKRVRF